MKEVRFRTKKGKYVRFNTKVKPWPKDKKGKSKIYHKGEWITKSAYRQRRKKEQLHW